MHSEITKTKLMLNPHFLKDGKKKWGRICNSCQKTWAEPQKDMPECFNFMLLPSQKAGFSAQAEWSLKARKADSPGRVWGSPISGPRGPPTRTSETPVFAEGDCLWGISLRQEVKCGDQKDLNGSCKEGWGPQGSGVQRGSRGRLSSLPHPRELSSVHTRSPVTQQECRGHPSWDLPGSILCVPEERGKPMMTTSPKHASLESVALGVFTDRNQGAEQQPTPAPVVPVSLGCRHFLKPWLTLTKGGRDA